MKTSNQTITFKGAPAKVVGHALAVGAEAPPFTITGNDLGDVSLTDFKGKVLILSVVPSLDTPVCSVQTKRFNEEFAALGENVSVLTVSMDLPFAQARWCGAEGVERVITASDYKHRSFGEPYGVYMPEAGLLARAVFVIDPAGKVAYVEYVQEVTTEPDYEAALTATKQLV